MKKSIIQYYALIILVLFILFNIILDALKLDGLIFHLVMIILCIFNTLFILINAKKIKYKGAILAIFFFVMLSANSIYHLLFVFSTMLFLAITCFNENIWNKVITLLILFVSITILPLFSLGFLLVYGSGKQTGLSDIYENMHYYCDNNYEAYAFSGGAMDSTHYSIGTNYEFLNINDILYIAYKGRNEVTRDTFDNYIENHDCYLAGEENEHR